MLLPPDLDYSSARPKPKQIADFYREAIRSKRLRTGDNLPGEYALADHLSISRQTVKEAINLLRAEGWLSGGGSGRLWRVRAFVPRRTVDASRYAEDLALLIQSGPGEALAERTRFCVDYGIPFEEFSVDARNEVVPATSVHAHYLRVEVGTPVLRRDMTECARGVPMQRHISVMPWSLVTDQRIAQDEHLPWPMGTLGELHAQGIRPDAWNESWQPRQATSDEARALDIPANLWLTEGNRVFSRDGHPVEYSELVLPLGTRLIFSGTLP